MLRSRLPAISYAVAAFAAFAWVVTASIAEAQSRPLSIRFAAGKSTFQAREPIEIEIAPEQGAPDGVDLREGPGGWRGIDVSLDRMDGVATPQRPLDAGFDDRWKGEPRYGTRFVLNGWFRFDAPGTYRVQVRSRSSPAATSNTLVLDIAPRDTAWEESALKRAVRTLDTSSAPVAVAVALSALETLATAASAVELVRRYRNSVELDGYDERMVRGLFNVADRRFVVDLLRKEAAIPARRIDGWFVRTLALLEMARAHPEGPPFSHDEYLAVLERESTARAQAIALDGGPAALATEIGKELADLGRYEDYFLAGALAPALRNFPAETAAAFRTLDIEPQLNILLWSWRRVAFQAMVPVLKSLYQSPKEDWAKLRDLALRRLFDVAPDEARPLMVVELERDELRVSTETLARLGAMTFPELEQRWLRHLQDGILDERLDGAVRIERFGSTAILADVTRLYQANRNTWSCEVRAAVLAYLMRVDRATGERAAKEAQASTAGEGDACRAVSQSPPIASPGMMIVAAGPVPGDESQTRFSIGEAIYDSPDALIAALSRWPRGTTIAWRYEDGTASTHLERWTLSERTAVFENIRRAAANVGITVRP